MLDGLRFTSQADDFLYIGIAGLMGLYFFLGLGVDLFRRRKHRDFGRIIIERGFNGATFAGSVALLLGIVFPDILRALGSLKPYLLFAGLTGLWYSSWALFKK